MEAPMHRDTGGLTCEYACAPNADRDKRGITPLDLA